MNREPIEKAMKVCGGRDKLAEYCGVTGSAISQWERVPAAHVLKISHLTGIAPEKIRPDLAPKDAA